MMKKIYVSLFAVLFGCSLFISQVAAEKKPFEVEGPFKGEVLLENLENPWNIVYGPDRMLWITERIGKRIIKVNPETGEKKSLLTIEDAHAGGQHFGVLGMALATGQSTELSLCFLYL